MGCCRCSRCLLRCCPSCHLRDSPCCQTGGNPGPPPGAAHPPDLRQHPDLPDCLHPRHQPRSPSRRLHRPCRCRSCPSRGCCCCPRCCWKHHRCLSQSTQIISSWSSNKKDSSSLKTSKSLHSSIYFVFVDI